MIRKLIVAGLGGIAALVLIGSASAARGELVSLDCGSAGSIDVVTNGNGQFTPGRIVGGGVVIPVGFSNQVATFKDSAGNVTVENPPDVSRRAPANKQIVSCSFSISGEAEGGTFSFSGDVQAFFVGRQ